MKNEITPRIQVSSLNISFEEYVNELRSGKSDSEIMSERNIKETLVMDLQGEKATEWFNSLRTCNDCPNRGCGKCPNQ